MDNNNDTVPFSPILIMEFIRQTTVARCLSGESADIAVRFKLAKSYYDEITAFPLKAQLIRLKLDYDEKAEILTVRTDEVFVNRSLWLRLPENMRGSMPKDIKSLLKSWNNQTYGGY